MCGITGFSGILDKETLVSMNQEISHRGPDDSGSWFHNLGKAGLAHRRLSIIDTSSAGKQPMMDPQSRAIISYNGEIYNYQELKNDLIADGFSFRTKTDTEVILNLYLRDGEKMLSKLNGIFAFALYDFSSETMLIARDGMGVKPFYYYFGDKTFSFSSELKSLLKNPEVPRELNPVSIANYLTYLWAPKDLTPLKEVKKLLPGQAMVLKEGKVVKEWIFYDIPFSSQLNDSMSLNEAIEMLDSTLETAVKRQMVADVPVGAFLSGGLDSSAVVNYARRFTDKKLETFTIRYNSDGNNSDGMVADLPYAEKVAKHLDVNLNVVSVGPELVNSLEKMIYFLDEPEGDPAALNAMFISQLARDNGVKVLLSGSGGDDLLTGYRRHFALAQEKYWAGLPKGMRRALSTLTQSFPTSVPIGRRIKKAFEYADLDRDKRLATYFFWINPSGALGLLNSDFRNQLGAEGVYSSLLGSLNNIDPNVHALNKMLYLECKHFLADHNLNYTDKMSMSCGVEVRVPFLDPDFVKFSCSLPIHFKQNGVHGKWIFKKAMEKYLPHEVIYRPKTGFGVPLRSWVKNELKEMIFENLSRESVERRGIFDFGAVESLIQKNLRNEIDGTYTIFSLLCIEQWCKKFLD